MLTGSISLNSFPQYASLHLELGDVEGKFKTWRNSSQVVGSPVNGNIMKGLLDYCSDSVAIVKIANGDYASEAVQPDGTYLITHLQGDQLFACSYDPLSKVSKPLAQVSTLPDLSSILALYMCMEADTVRENNIPATDNPISWELLTEAKSIYGQGALLPERIVRIVSDNLYFGLKYGGITSPTTIRGGSIALLEAKEITSEAFCTASVVCGTPEILVHAKKAVGINGKSTIADAKKLAADYVATLNWSEKEKDLIPVFPDEMEVPEEVMTILERFLKSRDWATPMNNPCWRGTTGFGKSTGVKMLGCILNTPVVVMTCSTTTETEDFLSKHVPVGKGKDNKKLSRVMSKITVDDCKFDAVYAYKQITGKDKADATTEEALEAYAKAWQALSKKSKKGDSPFKLVKSDFLKGLKRGYIVEVAEFSRIRNSGVLVGLNNFSDPGSVITLADGKHIRRHPNAMVVWTDNVGLESCHNVDASVLRRMSYIIDSVDMKMDRVIRRIRQNTNLEDNVFLTGSYKVWDAIKTYAKENDITDEGQCSIVELENWVRLTQLEGKDKIEETLQQAIISKLTSDPDTQKEIMENCGKLALSAAKLKKM